MTTTNFADIGVPTALSSILEKQGITTPTPIQAATLPDSLAGRDVLGRGRTGSGKTLAFVLPMLARLAASSQRRQSKRPRALILAPTRELAIQIDEALAPFAEVLGMRSRTVFGERLSTRQSMQFLLARMHARVHTARLAWVHAARLCDAGKPFTVDAAVAKMTASDAAMANARDATQVFGGNGFINEYPVARHYRDSKILEIGEGTTEVQLMILARDLGLTA